MARTVIHLHMAAYEIKWKQNTFNTIFWSLMNDFKLFQTLTFKKQSNITIKKNTIFPKL